MQKRNNPVSPPSFLQRVQPWCCAALVGAALSVAPQTRAAEYSTSGFVVPFFRGLADSEWAGWDTFTVAVGSPGNAPDVAGSTGNGVLTQSHPSGFLTGGGNIYSFAAPTSFNVTDSTPHSLGTVVFQVNTLGTEMNYGAVELRYDSGSGPQSLTATRVELARAGLGGFGGSGVTSLWQWDVSSLGIDDYSIAFDASGSSMSMAAVSLDSWTQFAPVPVPEPSTYALLALGGLALLASQRYRRKRS